MNNQDAEMLREAVARNVGVVLSLPSAGMIRHHKSRFLAQVDDGLIVEAPPDEASLLEEMIAADKLAGISFRNGTHKVIFATSIFRVEGKFKINAFTELFAVCVAFPTEIKSIQRRSTYRVEVPLSGDIAIRIWRLNVGAYIKEQPPSSQEVKAELQDLSTGGAGVKLIGKNGEMPKICPEDRLRVQLSFEGEDLILEGKMRPPAKPPRGDTIVTGVQFKKLENDLEGRRILAQVTKLVGELQRSEARRLRLGLASPAR